MYKWKPTAAQKAAYAAKMREREALPIKGAKGAIRTGCKLKFYSVNWGCVVSGIVVNHSYGADKGQHTFTISTDEGNVMVKGRNLYPNIIDHQQGEESLKLG
jgi:hypothetical protein